MISDAKIESITKAFSGLPNHYTNQIIERLRSAEEALKFYACCIPVKKDDSAWTTVARAHFEKINYEQPDKISD